MDDRLYTILCKKAAEENRSIQQQVVHILQNDLAPSDDSFDHSYISREDVINEFVDFLNHGDNNDSTVVENDVK